MSATQPPPGAESRETEETRPSRQSVEASSLRGEFRSILALYCLGAILPLLIGLIFGPESS